MTHKKLSNIRQFVWEIIDTDISIKKDISRGIINMRALANYMISRYKLDVSVDSIISAIRRYNFEPEKKRNVGEVLNLLKQAKIKTLTRMASISLKKNESVTKTISKVLPNINYETGETFRVIEGSKLFKVFIDQRNMQNMVNLFGKTNIIEKNKHIAMVEILYPDILMQIPGVFSVISTELGGNDISIIDALICSNEHIVVVDEKDITKSFEILYDLCN